MALLKVSSAIVIAAALLTASCTAQADFRDRLVNRLEDRLTEAPAPGAVEMAYGSHARQRLDFWPVTQVNAPLIVFVHGGGWTRGDKRNATGAAKVQHMRDQGYAFASVNYRLVPEVRVEDQAADIASAVAYLRTHAGKLGIDPTRIILMGHSAGAHLAALVGTDERYMMAAGLSLGDLAGVIPLDGAAYDVPTQLNDSGRLMEDTYDEAFGADVARQNALSPTRHAATPNAPAFLILHVDRSDGRAQSQGLAKALSAAGTPVTLREFGGKGLRGHMQINRNLGDAAYPATAVVDAWTKNQFELRNVIAISSSQPQ